MLHVAFIDCFGLRLRITMVYGDLHVNQISPRGALIDYDSEPRCFRNGYVSVAIALKSIGGELTRQRFRRKRVFASFIVPAGVGLQGCAESEVRREGVIHKSYTALNRIVGHTLGGTDAADPSTIHLNVSHPTVVDQMLRHKEIVGALSPR